eukprot:628772-Pyramimonas_sp.AAC.1
MRTPRLRPSVELPMGPCEHRHWSLRWSSLWGHDTCEGCAEIGGGDACEHRHWGLRWSPPVGPRSV